MTEKGCWEQLETVIGYSDRILLYGVAGTGKTYQANRFGLKKGQGTYNITLTADSTATELMGHYIATSDGGFRWKDGNGTRAFKEGSRLVINEIDHAGPDVSSVLHAILDDADIARLTLPNKKKETVQPSQGFSVIATMNGTPDMLPEALADRFGVKINIDSVHPDAIATLPEEYRTVYSERDGTDIPASIRAWKEFSKLVSAGVDLRSSATVCFGNDYAEDVVDAIELQDV